MGHTRAAITHISITASSIFRLLKNHLIRRHFSLLKMSSLLIMSYWMLILLLLQNLKTSRYLETQQGTQLGEQNIVADS